MLTEQFTIAGYSEAGKDGGKLTFGNVSDCWCTGA